MNNLYVHVYLHPYDLNYVVPCCLYTLMLMNEDITISLLICLIRSRVGLVRDDFFCTCVVEDFSVHGGAVEAEWKELASDLISMRVALLRTRTRDGL